MPLIPRAALGRRLTALVCAATVLAGASGCATDRSAHRAHSRHESGPADETGPVPTGTWAGAGEPVRTSESVLQIVAHPDDDLFFLNPETAQSLRSGRPLTTVFLTSGEGDGVNAPRKNVRGAAAPARKRGERGDKAVYTEARQNGIRAAYAEMATGDRDAAWRRTVLRTAGGGRAELDTLRGHPDVRLVWNLLREAGSLTKHRPHSLYGLWTGETRRLGSQLSSAGPVTGNFHYTRAQLVDTLVGYLQRFRPTQIRMQDPTPGRLDRNGKYADHQDHFAGARFVQEALVRHADDAARGRAPHFTVSTYLGYFNGGLPHVLGGRTARGKLRTLETYAWADRAERACRYAAGCGDLKMVPSTQHLGWSHGIRHTDGESTAWLRAAKDGSLTAYSVLDGRIAVRHRPAGTGARWDAPTLLPATGIDPSLTSVDLPDGRTALFGTRTVTEDGPGGYRKEVGWTVQAAGGSGGSGFGPWQSLGTPEPGDLAGLSDISAPAVAVTPDGTVTAVVRTSRHQLSARTRQPDGTWTPWQALGGTGLHGAPSAGVDEGGRLYVFATTAKTVLAWTRPSSGGALSGPRATGLPAVTGRVAVHPDGHAAVRLHMRAPVTGHVRTARIGAAALGDASGSSAPVRPARVTDLGGAAGYGPVSATPLPDGRTLLAARAGNGDLQTAVVDERRGRTGRVQPAAARVRWSRTGFLFAGAPASVPAPGGRGGDVAVLGLDGRLYWARTGTQGTAGWRAA
ncbi:PIG-L family deacetylase [Streptomyces cacaoi]|uniref:PIG-L family deacetylase n=2 Tax=Streptomyces cacaoi TaxID=1898 RepID=A0A4Y3R5L4_STRCI|nr:PIG-L family deacetylase [Streptomyces cacaoi]GEB52083.1 hypothetical protein SCA03_46340 [Streptomyces cacaoi]